MFDRVLNTSLHQAIFLKAKSKEEPFGRGVFDSAFLCLIAALEFKYRVGVQRILSIKTNRAAICKSYSGFFTHKVKFLRMAVLFTFHVKYF